MRLSDFLPPILMRRPFAQRKELSGSIEFWPSVAEFLNPSSPTYESARNYESLAKAGYSANVYLYRAVNLISQGMAGIPWKLYKKTGSGGKDKREEVESHPLLDLLNVEANGEQTGPEFIEWFAGYWLLAGHSYLLALRPDSGARAPGELWTLQPNLVRPHVDQNTGQLQGWIYEEYGHKQEFAIEDVLRVKDFNPLNRSQGLSPARVAARAVDQHNSANDANTALLQNNMRPSGILSPKDATTVIPPEAHESLKTELRERYSGPKNAGRPLVPRMPMAWQQIGANPAEMDWLAGKTQAAREIAVPFGVPPVLLDDKDNATYNNLKEAKRALMTQTILPRMDRLAPALGRFLLPMWGLSPAQYELGYDKEGIEELQEDRDAQHTRARSDYAGGLITLNEARADVGKDAVDEGDVLLAPPRAMTIDQLLEGAGLPAMPDDGVDPHAPAALPPGGAPHPPALPAGTIVDAGPGSGASNGGTGTGAGNNPAGNGNGKSVMRPFAVSRAVEAQAARGRRGQHLRQHQARERVRRRVTRP